MATDSLIPIRSVRTLEFHVHDDEMCTVICGDPLYDIVRVSCKRYRNADIDRGYTAGVTLTLLIFHRLEYGLLKT